MPRASNGDYSLFTPGNPVVTLTVISSTWANNTLSDLATAMTDSLSRSGDGGMLAGLELFSGTIGAPGLTWGAETTSGLYRAGAGDFRFAIGGVDVFSFGGGGGGGVGFANGTVAAPSIYFISDPDTGWYRGAANRISAAVGGVNSFNFDSTGNYSALTLFSVDGSAAAPSYAFTTDTDTGIYRVGADNLGFSVGGAARLAMTTTVAQFQGTVQVQAAGNGVGAPAYSFSGDPNTGFYNFGADQIGVSSGGSLVGLWTSAQFEVPDGLVGTPGVAFLNDTNTGVYRVGADDIALAAGGVRAFHTNASQAYFLDGTAALPSLTFDTDPDTGLYRSGTNGIGFASSGAAIAILDAVSFGVIDGNAARPGLTFFNDTDTGLYLDSANSMSFSAGNGQRFRIRTGDIVSQVQHFFADGTNANPGIVFTADSNTGIYRPANDFIGLTAGGSFGFGITTTEAIVSRPLFRADGIHNGTAPTGAANQYIASGTYTPTISSTTNLDSTTPGVCQWIRVGNVVTVSGEIGVDPTAAALAQFTASLPIASALSATTQLTGAGTVNRGPPGLIVSLRGDVGADGAVFTWQETGTSATVLWFIFQYLVL